MLGQDVLSLVHVALQACAGTNEQCYMDIIKVFDVANIQIDQSLDRRGFASLQSKTFKSVIEIFSSISAILLSNWILKSQEAKEQGLYLSGPIATSAGSLASVIGAVVTISADGTAVATITQALDTTSLIG